MDTQSALAIRPLLSLPPGQGVTTMANLLQSGWSRGRLRAQLDAGRWQRRGRAIVLHNGPLHPDELATVARYNCGPRSALTAFSAAAIRGLKGWEREAIHVLVPAGARIRRLPGLVVAVHWSADWTREDVFDGLHALAPSLVVAGATLPTPRPACGLLAASVQQRLLSADDLRRALTATPRTRHKAALMLAVEDIAQGAQALSEIDFGRLCRRGGLPEPTRQAVRIEPSGRRRYLDAEWKARGRRRVVAEVDGALHLVPRRWWDDQVRQNELVITGDLVLRFPSVLVRCEPSLVIDQLRRAITRWC